MLNNGYGLSGLGVNVVSIENEKVKRQNYIYKLKSIGDG
jgi:hypothetical protein